jgi:hypothetical protein
LKAFCLAIAFLLAALPARAEELPQTGNAWRANEPDMAEPGNFKWTVIDDNATGAKAPAATPGPEAREKSAPARAALAEIRAQTARLVDAARRNGSKVERIRYDLRLRCVVEEIDTETEPLANTKMPWIWGSVADSGKDTSGMFEMCEIDYSQKVRSQAEPQEKQPDMVDYAVSIPMSQ